MKRNITILRLLFAICLMVATGCVSETQTAPPPATELTVSLLYPTETTEIEMGQSIKSIVRVLDERGNPVGDAQVTLEIKDPAGNLVASLPSTFGDGDVYRTDIWTVPNKMHEGVWTLMVEAESGACRGTASGTLQVNASISEILLNKYGFWVDAPTLRGIVPSLVKEQGDAQNGVIIWGGIIPTQHIFQENWLEVHWREGNFDLESADDVRGFMLNELGDIGFTPVRDLGPFERVRFKDWEAWQVGVRGQFLRYDIQWMIFYAPEVNKTYAIGTTVVQPPTGLDAHAFLRDGFEVHSEFHAQGVAPKPLPRLLPPPKLVGPEIGAQFFGTDQPVILLWQPVKQLAQDEYYLVSIDYNYTETNPRYTYATHATQFTMPESLYRLPNCAIFNWRITLMRQTGVGEDGQPLGEPVSFNSLYWYIQWRYPPGEPAPFDPRCPNEQF